MLPVTHFIAVKSAFPIRQVKSLLAFLLKLTPFYNHLLASTTPKSLPFLYETFAMSLLCFLSLSLFFFLFRTFGKNYLPSLYFSVLRLLLLPGPSFLPSDDTGDVLTRRDALLHVSTLPYCLLYLSYPLISSFGLKACCLVGIVLRTSLPIFSEQFLFPRHARWVCSRLLCREHIYCLFGIGRIANPLCSACGRPIRHTFYYILSCRTTALRRRLLYVDFWS